MRRNVDIELIMTTTSPRHRWFCDARFGMFVHFGPYAAIGRGEQVLFREQWDQAEYARRAARWNPRRFDAAQWAAAACAGGVKYGVLTTRHHDGYCLWDSKQTDYTSARLAPQRDFVREYGEAMRAAGLRVGLYYSLADWRIPAYWAGPKQDPDGWARFRRYVHTQLHELLTGYGRIDVLWFDGAWPHTAQDWGAREIVRMARRLQPGILINNRLGQVVGETGLSANESRRLGDFGTPEHHITAESSRLWESCQVSTWRLWGYARGERWRSTDVLLDMLADAASKGGNLLLNVGPKPDGTLPPPFVRRLAALGAWLKVHGEAIYGTQAGDVCDSVTIGYQTRRGSRLYLIVRFWDGSGTLRLAGLGTRVRKATMLADGRALRVRQSAEILELAGLPRRPPTRLFPVIELTCAGGPEPTARGRERLWAGDPLTYRSWAAARGEGVMQGGGWSEA